jgi:hypothetical protein
LHLIGNISYIGKGRDPLIMGYFDNLDNGISNKLKKRILKIEIIEKSL